MSLQRNLIKFLLINLVLGLTQEKVLKIVGSPLGRAGPMPRSGASFSAFSTVSVSGPVASSLDGAVGPNAAAVSGAALFHEECRQDPEFRKRVLGLDLMLRVKTALSGSETVPVSKVYGAVPGVSVLDDGMDGACLSPRASPVAEDTFVNNVHDFDDCLNDADSALGVRDQPVRSVAGESSGTIGLHEVSESDSSLHISRVTNSLNSSLGVDMSACALDAAAVPAAAAPRSWSTVARLSGAVVAHAHASPVHCARNSGAGLSFSGGIPGSFSESQLDNMNDPAVKRLDAVLNVCDSGACPPFPARHRDIAFSCPLSRRLSGSEMLVSSSWFVCLLVSRHPLRGVFLLLYWINTLDGPFTLDGLMVFAGSSLRILRLMFPRPILLKVWRTSARRLELDATLEEAGLRMRPQVKV